ncbi:nitroreductase/quinone reductase family protein [Flexivirga meconopsidis]|uniref:nitroreductase/quinone reductase family protein n=1 Tax=Flexivirga meconopsidis TaxID=2977121 RepID=UPI00223F61D3|nr:nitroreductase/quinone reductase family protein [Flexivirga meconopsidis]
MAQQTYHRPGIGTRVFNTVVAFLARRGISVAGARELVVTGRTSGQPRRTPVNLLRLDGADYLVAPRGITQWVRNVRKQPSVGLRLGKQEDRYAVQELHGADAVPVLRLYLKKWAWEVGAFFPEGVTARSTDAELLAVIPDHPVFRLVRV